MEVIEKERFGKVEALAITNARGRLQIDELLEAFDAFRNHRHPERVAQEFDGFEDALTARPLVNGRMNERSTLISSAVMSASADNDE